MKLPGPAGHGAKSPMQLFCLTAMEPPNSWDADSIRNEKTKALQATHLADIDDLSQSAVRGTSVG
jgi:glucose-6-phosphate 1-dehydrogenase